MNIGTFKSFDSDDCLLPSASDLLPFRTTHVPDWVRKKAVQELNETEENREECLRKMKELIAADDSLRGVPFHDDFLVQFLRQKKYAVDRAFAHVRKCVQYGESHPEILDGLPDEYVDLNAACDLLMIMPRRCPEGCVVLLYKVENWEPDEFPQPMFERLLMMMYLQVSRDPCTQVNGVKIIIDCKGMNMKHLAFASPSNIKNIYNFSTDWLTCRWRAFHILNGSEPIRLIWSIILKFSEKLQKRVFFHSSLSELHATIPPCVLPTEYGGTVSDLQETRDWLRNANEEHKKMTPGGMPNWY